MPVRCEPYDPMRGVKYIYLKQKIKFVCNINNNNNNNTRLKTVLKIDKTRIQHGD